MMFIDSLDDDVEQLRERLLYNGIKIPGIQTRIRIEFLTGDTVESHGIDGGVVGVIDLGRDGGRDGGIDKG